MDEKIETPIAEQPQTPAPAPEPSPTPEAVPDWNTPKPVEDELKKYSGGKGLKIFFVLALIIILAAIGLFLYKTVIGGVTPTEQFQRQPTVTEPETIAPTTVTEETTVEEDIEEIDNFNVEELDQIIEETDLEDLNL